MILKLIATNLKVHTASTVEYAQQSDILASVYTEEAMYA